MRGGGVSRPPRRARHLWCSSRCPEGLQKAEGKTDRKPLHSRASSRAAGGSNYDCRAAVGALHAQRDRDAGSMHRRRPAAASTLAHYLYTVTCHRIPVRGHARDPNPCTHRRNAYHRVPPRRPGGPQKVRKVGWDCVRLGAGSTARAIIWRMPFIPSAPTSPLPRACPPLQGCRSAHNAAADRTWPRRRPAAPPCRRDHRLPGGGGPVWSTASGPAQAPCSLHDAAHHHRLGHPDH